MVIRAHMPESQSVWTLPTKSIKNSLGPIPEEEWKSETYREKKTGARQPVTGKIEGESSDCFRLFLFKVNVRFSSKYELLEKHSPDVCFLKLLKMVTYMPTLIVFQAVHCMVYKGHFQIASDSLRLIKYLSRSYQSEKNQ